MGISDTLRYITNPDAAASAANVTFYFTRGNLPDVHYNMLRLQLYADYTVNKASSVRMDYIYNRTFFDEWTYGYGQYPFLFADNTTVSAKQLQSVNFIRASYVYKFQ